MRRRLWLGAGAVALFVATAALTLAFVTPGWDTCRRHLGHDFLPFYVAGSIVREGHGADLYDLDVIRAREQQVAAEENLALGDAIGPWWNPPPYAWVFAPLSRLTFSHALLVWTGVNLAAGATAAWLLSRLVPGCGALVALLVLVSSPFLQSVTHGQNSPTSLLLLTAITLAWRRGRNFAAGALCAVLCYKPQLAAVISVILVLHRGTRAAGGLMVVGAALLAITAVTMPGALSDYVQRLPGNLHEMQVRNTYLWERHVTLKSFWRLLLQGRGPGETTLAVHILTAVTALPAGVALVAGAWRARRSPGSTDAVLSASIAVAPLIMPFYFDYDLLLLAVPGALAARHYQPSRRTRWLLAAGSSLYLWLFVNPYVGGATRINLAVPLLSAVAGLLIAPLFPKEGVAEESAVETVPASVPLAKAA